MAVSAYVEDALFVSTTDGVVLVPPQSESVIPSGARESGDLLQSGVVKMSSVRADLPEEGV